jgi:hypothetical protein
MAIFSRREAVRRGRESRLGLIAAVLVLLWAAPSGAQAPCGGCPNFSFALMPRSYPLMSVPFGSPVSISQQALVADFNNDGIPDVAVIHPGALGTRISIYLGTGAGRLPTPLLTDVTTLNPSYPYGSFAVGDFDGDGRIDLILSSGFDDRNLYLLRGLGDGTFRPPIVIPAPVSPIGLIAGDFNGDGRLDVAYTETSVDGSDVLWISLGDGAGGFAPAISIPIGSGASDPHVADLTGDGIDDIVFANRGSDDLSLVRGSATGSFPSWESIHVGTSPGSLAVGDWNEDGHLDLAVNTFFGGLVTLLNNGDGNFGSPSTIYPQAAYIRALYSGDFNGDGHTDLAMDTNTTVYLFRGDGAGNFSSGSVMGPGIYQAVAVDFDHDGVTDLVGSTGLNVVVELTSSQRFEETYAPPSVNNTIVVGDFDGDGRPDLALVGQEPSVDLLWNDPPGFTIGNEVFVGPAPLFVAAVDLNHDKRDDLVVAFNGQIGVLLAGAGRTFGPMTPYEVGSFPSAFAIGDFNNDGNPDLAVLNSGGESVSILLGDGSGGFLPQIQYAVGAASSIASADFDGDGNLDIALATYDGNVEILLGDGAGHLKSIQSFPAGAIPTSVVAADFDGDGKPDVAVLTGNPTSDVSILRGDGSGGLLPPTSFPIGFPGGQLLAADLNGDGAIDLVASGGRGSGGQMLLRNDGSANFAPPVGFYAFTLTEGLSGTAAGDFDSDGRLDLATTDPSSGIVTVFRNTNCQSRRLEILKDIVSCAPEGTPLDSEPVLTVTDDGDNRIACDNGAVTASIVPGTGTAGAVLGGMTSVSASAGVATFTNLSIDRSGLAYELNFSHPVARSIRSRSFNVNGLLQIAGPMHLCTRDADVFNATPGYEQYLWTLGGSPVGTGPQITLQGLPAGTQTLKVQASCGSSGVTAQLTVTVDAVPSAVVSGVAGTVCPYLFGNPASVPDAGPGATYIWTIKNGVITGGAGTASVTYTSGAPGPGQLTAVVTNTQGCSATGTAAFTVNSGGGCASPVGFFTVTPCRLVDTRGAAGPLGGPALAAKAERTFTVVGNCGIPVGARAVSVNVTVTQGDVGGDLRLYPGTAFVPSTSVINYGSGQTRANNAVISLGAAGDLAVRCDQPSGAVDFILDVNGYFQ